MCTSINQTMGYKALRFYVHIQNRIHVHHHTQKTQANPTPTLLVLPYIKIPYLHCPAFSTPFATLFAPSSSPVPPEPNASPRGFPALPDALLIVSPRPRVAAPVTPPAVRVTPPTVLPSVDVTHLAAPVAPWSEVPLPIGIMLGGFVWLLDFRSQWFEKDVKISWSVRSSEQ